MSNKDWKANSKSIYVTMGANNHSKHDRAEHDFYATHPDAVDKLFQVFQGSGDLVWECAAGMGHMYKRIKELGWYQDYQATELVERDNCLVDDIEFGVDFLKIDFGDEKIQADIITNPPYKYAEEFIRHAYNIIDDGYFVCMFLPIRYLEGKKRKLLFRDLPLYKIAVMSERIECARNGEFNKRGNSAQGYAWFIWYKGWEQDAIVEWV